jgi:hypothetical protein
MRGIASATCRRPWPTRRRCARCAPPTCCPESGRLPLKLPGGETAQSHLAKLCEAAMTRMNHAHSPPHRRRLDEELDLIAGANLAGVLLACHEIAEEASRRAWPLNLRGSAGSSLVARLLGLTQADPVAEGLRVEPAAAGAALADRTARQRPRRPRRPLPPPRPRLVAAGGAEGQRAVGRADRRRPGGTGRAGRPGRRRPPHTPRRLARRRGRLGEGAGRRQGARRPPREAVRPPEQGGDSRRPGRHARPVVKSPA